ncbi:hypothetical protein [Microbacterium aurum]
MWALPAGFGDDDLLGVPPGRRGDPRAGRLQRVADREDTVHPDHPVEHRRADLRERRVQDLPGRGGDLRPDRFRSALQPGRGARVHPGEVLDQFGHVPASQV